MSPVLYPLYLGVYKRHRLLRMFVYRSIEGRFDLKGNETVTRDVNGLVVSPPLYRSNPSNFLYPVSTTKQLG